MSRISHILMAWGSALSIMLLQTSSVAPATRIWQRTDGPFRGRALVWAPADFTEANLRSFYLRLAPAMKGRRAWLVDVFVDEGDATRELHGKFASEGTYERWLWLYDRFGRHLLPMAKFYGLEDSAVLRLRDAAGVCYEIVLAGTDFLRLNSAGIKFELLEIGYHPLPPSVKPTSGDDAMVSVWVRASQLPNTDQARDVSRLLQDRFLEKRVRVHFRTDSYFITDDSFPIMYRFDQEPNPPDKEGLSRSNSISCFCERPGIRCVQGSP